MKKKSLFLILAILFAGIIIFATHDTLKATASNSYIESRISEYITAEKWDNEALPSDIPEDSAEALFMTGMKFYAEGNTAEAEKYFKQAESKPYTDIALPVYLNIYLNECEIIKTGSGNVTYVQQALNHIIDYPPAMHQISLIWSLVSSVMDEKNADISSQELLKEFIKNADELKKDEVLLLETYLAVLKNINGDYSESIILFCNLWNKAQDMKESPLVTEAKSFCIDYLADMYYLYEDYDKAISLYQKQLNQDIKDPYENAGLKYTAYINCGEVYVKLKNYNQAKKTVAEAKKILPYLPEDERAEVDACLHNISANIELEQGNLNGAKEYFANCEDAMQDRENDAFFDTAATLNLTHSKILKASGDLKQAEKLLIETLTHALPDTPARYELRELLMEIYQTTGQNEKYLKEQDLLLQEQNERIEQYQADYCAGIEYYSQLLTLKKKHDASIQHNRTLIGALLVALLLLGFIIKLSLLKYRDSITDTLTGLYNRKKLNKELLLYPKNTHQCPSYGVIMVDIDFFKKYNDTYGHAAGDTVLSRVASIVKGSVRDKDIVIRYGGEEILVLLKTIDDSTTASIAEKIRFNIEHAQIPHKASECSDYVTLSVGYFYMEQPDLIDLADAITNADKALYNSKQNGRNSVSVYSA